MIEILDRDMNRVATARLTSREVIVPRCLSIPKIEMFYFKAIDLAPPIVFRHLAGVALTTWLDGSYLSDVDAATLLNLGPCKYVHGRSEVMKGKHSISAVLLALVPPEFDVQPTEWMVALPELYKQFLGILDLSADRTWLGR